MIKSGYWTNKAPYRRIQTETLSYDPCLAIHVRWYTDAALCCGLLLLLLQTLHSSNIVVILSCCLDAHVLLLPWYLQVWLALPNREEIRVLASISAGFAQNIMCAYNGWACSIHVHTSRWEVLDPMCEWHLEYYYVCIWWMGMFHRNAYIMHYSFTFMVWMKFRVQLCVHLMVGQFFI
jgi:hypothetical protein